MATYDLDIRILGGLPVSVTAYTQPADPSVGIFSEWCEDFEITYICTSGRYRKLKNDAWLRKRINAKPGEYERVIEAIHTAMDEQF